jgi:hypothetical protein
MLRQDVTVRFPGARSAPMTRTRTCSQLGAHEAGTKGLQPLAKDLRSGVALGGLDGMQHPMLRTPGQRMAQGRDPCGEVNPSPPAPQAL